MKKTIFITNIIKATFIFMLLVFAFIKNEQLYLRMMILPFILLVICNIAKNLCNLLNKPIGVKIFHRLFIIIFLLFGASFLLGWSYVFIKQKQYFPIIFTIPFWLFEIHFFRKYILNIKKNKNKKVY